MSIKRRAPPAAAVLAILSVAALLIAPRADRAVRERVEAAVSQGLAALEAETGLSVAFDSLAPSILRSVDFRGLVMRQPGTSFRLEARRLSLRYDLAAVIEGEPWRAIKDLRLEGVKGDIELPRDAALLTRLSRYLVGPPGAPPPSLSMGGKDISLRIASPGLGEARIHARGFGYSSLGPESELTVSGDYELFGRSAGGESPALLAEGPLELAENLAKDLSRARFSLAAAASGRGYSLGTQRFELAYGEGTALVTKVRDKAPLDAELRYDTLDGSLSAQVRMEGFTPARSLSVAGPLAALDPWLESSYSGTVKFSIPRGDSALASYDILLEGGLPAGLVSLPGRPHFAGRARIAAKGDSGSVEVQSARIDDGADFIEYRGLVRFRDLAPDGQLDLSLGLMEGRLPLSGSFRLFGGGGEYAAFSPELDAGGVTLRDVYATAALRNGRVDFGLSLRPPEAMEGDSAAPPLRYSGEAGAGSGVLPRISCEGSLDFGSGAGPAAELALSLDELDLLPMRPLLERALDSPELAALASGLKLDGEVFATSDFKRLSWSASDLVIVSRSAPGAYALLSLSGNTESLNVRRARLFFAGYALEGSGKLAFAEAGKLGFEAKLRLQDIPYEVRGALVGGGVFITGDYGLEFSARSSEGETYLSLAARELPIPAAGGILLASLDADGRFSSASDWGLVLSSLSLVPTGESLAALPRVGLSGSLGPGSGEFKELRIEDGISVVAGPATLAYSIEGGIAGRLRASLAGTPKAVSPRPRPQGAPPAESGDAGRGTAAAPEERYELDLSYARGELEGQLSFTASPLSRIPDLPLSGSVDGLLRVTGPPAEMAASFELQLRGAVLDGDPLSLSAAGSYTDASLGISALRGLWRSQEIQSGSGSISLRDASATLRLRYSGKLAGERAGASLELVGRSAAVGGLSLSALLAEYSVTGTATELAFAGLGAGRVPFSIERSSTGLAARAGAAGEVDAFLSTDGFFSFSARQPFPLALRATGKVAGDSVEARLDGLDMDLAAFAHAFSGFPVTLEAGSLRGSLAVSGKLADPEIRGELILDNASLSAKDWLPGRIGPFTAPLRAEGRSFTFEASYLPLGSAVASLRASAVLDHWVPTSLIASLRTLAGTRVKVDARSAGASVQGELALDLTAELRGETLLVSGEATLEKAAVVIGAELLGSGGAGGASSSAPSVFLSLSTLLRIGHGVQIFFPSRDLPIVSGYADPSSSLSLRFDQAKGDYSVKGNVTLRGGDVFYIQRSFFLKNARLAFNETAAQFDPRVTLVAELRDRNEEGPVLITLRTDNAPLSNFKPRLSSDPPMTEAQIAALLGAGLLATSSDSRLDLRKAVISGSEFIPQLNVTKAFESRVRDSLGLDVFFVRTQILKRWLIDISDSAAPTVTDPLGRYLDQTEIYAGKYLGDKVFFSGSARLREDPLVDTSRLRLDSEIGIEFDTPFGLVQWKIAPSRPENLFISDQSLSISWRLSY